MPVTITHTWAHLNPEKSTIYTALKAKLGREPTHAELNADVVRILRDARADMARANQDRRDAMSPAARRIHDRAIT